jgi:hypothetical protein
MTYRVDWLIPQRVVVIEINGDYTAQDLNESTLQVRDQFLDTGVAPVHLICDVRHITSYPTQIFVIKQASEIYLRHPNMGRLVLVGFDNPLMRFIANAVSQTMRARFQQANSVEEAVQGLKAMDETLADPA